MLGDRLRHRFGRLWGSWEPKPRASLEFGSEKALGHWGGHPTWDAFAAAFAKERCVVCGVRGCLGDNDMEMVAMGRRSRYAHQACAVFGRLYPEMRTTTRNADPPCDHHCAEHP